MKEIGFYVDDWLAAYCVNRQTCKQSEVPKLAEKWLKSKYEKTGFGNELADQIIHNLVERAHLSGGYIQYYPKGREDIYQDDPDAGVWAECPKSTGAVPVYFLVFRNEEDDK